MQDKLCQWVLDIGDKVQCVVWFYCNILYVLVEIVGVVGLNLFSDFLFYYFMFCYNDGMFQDGNEVYFYMFEGFLFFDQFFEELDVWCRCWKCVNVEIFVLMEIFSGWFNQCCWVGCVYVQICCVICISVVVLCMIGLVLVFLWISVMKFCCICGV